MAMIVSLLVGFSEDLVGEMKRKRPEKAFWTRLWSKDRFNGRIMDAGRRDERPRMVLVDYGVRGVDRLRNAPKI